MIKYIKDVLKSLKKGLLPKEIFEHINNVFRALDATKDLALFDIKQLKTGKDSSHVYYRLRKGKYRAIFYLEGGDIYVIALNKREEIYKKWQ
jgi:mRNA interferase RelE/StbE